MTEPNTAAFPSVEVGHYYPRVGLSTREYFAALAMQGLLGNSVFTVEDANFISALAVEHADALISQLNATPAP